MVSLLQGAFQAIDDETKALKVKDVLEKTRNVSAREKKFLFTYLREGNLPESQRTVSNDPNQNIKITEGCEEYV